MNPAEADERRGLDVNATFERLRDAYFRYYDTPFGLADDRLQWERRELFNRDNGAYRLPLIELRPDYATAPRALAQSIEQCGTPSELADFAECGLIPAGRPLYLHQERALVAGLSAGRNMIVTAGTGSGKTESFLLPVLGSLLEESRGWDGGRAPHEPWWRHRRPGFESQRAGETGRPSAVRALVLYPMNALVDDQLMRMRRALDSDATRAWLDANRRGHRFYFGRYTGATPVTGSRAIQSNVERLRQVLIATEERALQAAELAAAADNDDVQYFVPRLDGAEMRSRWDMADAPPDVLVTNYSMLNVMLLRERDDHYFESTRAWLDASEITPLHHRRRRAPYVSRHGRHGSRLPAAQPETTPGPDESAGPTSDSGRVSLDRRGEGQELPRAIFRCSRRFFRVCRGQVGHASCRHCRNIGRSHRDPDVRRPRAARWRARTGSWTRCAGPLWTARVAKSRSRHSRCTNWQRGSFRTSTRGFGRRRSARCCLLWHPTPEMQTLSCAHITSSATYRAYGPVATQLARLPREVTAPRGRSDASTANQPPAVSVARGFWSCFIARTVVMSCLVDTHPRVRLRKSVSTRCFSQMHQSWRNCLIGCAWNGPPRTMSCTGRIPLRTSMRLITQIGRAILNASDTRFAEAS